jgi:hypothetical protein
MKKTKFILVIMGLLTGILVMACSDPPTPTPTAKGFTIRYQLTGLETAEVTYTNSTGAFTSLGVVNLPWETSFSVTIQPNTIYTAYISGRSASYGEGGALTAKVFVNGKEEDSKTAESQTYVQVSASHAILNN